MVLNKRRYVVKRINNKCAFDIIPFGEKEHWIVSRGRAYILTENNTVKFISPYLQDLTGVFWNDKQEQFLYYNTTGKCICTEAYKEEELFKIFTRSFAENPIACINGDYIYIDKAEKLKLFSFDKKMSVNINFSYKVYRIIRYKDKFIMYTEKEKGDYYIKLCSLVGEKMICEKEMPVPGVFIDCMQLHNNDSVVLMNSIEWDGMWETNICYIDVENWKYHRLFFCKDVCEEPQDFLPNRFSVSPDGKLIAMIHSESVQIYDMKEKRIIFNQPLIYGSDVCWKNNSELLIGTWKGLYIHSI